MDDSVGDLLLRWMSEVGSGTITDLRGRIEWISRTADLDPPGWASGRWLRDVSSLGHCELDWKSGHWSIAPPALVRLPGGDGLAVLAGARRPRTMRAIDEFWGELSPARREPPSGEIPLPMTLYAAFRTEAELGEGAAESGIALAGLAAQRIARALTSVEPQEPTAPPAYGSEVQRLEKTQPRKWVPASATQSNPPDGLYTEQVHGRPRYITRRSGQWFASELATGTFAELARRAESAVRWRPDSERKGADSGTLFVDWGAPLPVLHSRALVLCTGLPPRFGTVATTAIYENVPRTIAARVCTSLGQALVID